LKEIKTFKYVNIGGNPQPKLPSMSVLNSIGELYQVLLFIDSFKKPKVAFMFSAKGHAFCMATILIPVHK
jgi:hypothetical protein